MAGSFFFWRKLHVVSKKFRQTFMVAIGHKYGRIFKWHAYGPLKPLLLENLVGQGDAVASESFPFYLSDTVDTQAYFFDVFLFERSISDFLENLDACVDDVQLGEIIKNVVPWRIGY